MMHVHQKYVFLDFVLLFFAIVLDSLDFSKKKKENGGKKSDYDIFDFYLFFYFFSIHPLIFFYSGDLVSLFFHVCLL
jgi:hypothetical protein